MVVGGIVKTWSGTQATLALSRREAEYNAIVRAIVEGRCHVDRVPRGLGQRHLEVKHLWLQDAVRRGQLTFSKMRGDANPGDWLTKPLPMGGKRKELLSWGFELLEAGGRARGS